MAKRLFKVTILFSLIISIFCINFSFASNGSISEVSYVCELNYNTSVNSQFNKDIAENGTYLFSYQTIQANGVDDTDVRAGIYNDTGVPLYYTFYEDANNNVCLIIGCEKGSSNYVYVAYKNIGYSYPNGRYAQFTGLTSWINHPTYNIAYRTNSNSNIPEDLNHYDSLDEAVAAIEDYITNPPPPAPIYTKNANVDEFIANNLISMGIKFDTPSDALSYASDAWDWCIDEDNLDSVNAFDKWNIESFVSYCNAQSNNYLNWYNGYKLSADVTKALGVYIRNNIQSLTGLPSGVTSLTASYLPIGHYGSGFTSGATSPSAQTFYPAQTITYFNGEYVNETNEISTSQFLYTPPDVRRFLGYPGSSPAITPSSPTGTGTINDDPNNPDQKNITINFPALDWLADAIKSILDFLRDAFTTLANLLTQLLDAILGLFSDAFDSLSEFGQGLIEWLYEIVAGFSSIGGDYIPASLWAIIMPFILINIGVGLIMFVLRSH